MTPFGLTILLGAFLLFQVQPILGKCLVPWFGGGAGTWTTCILFFQLMLLAGYGYAHLLGTRLSRRQQTRMHLGVVGLSLLFLPLPTGGASWQAGAGARPEVAITLLLLVRVGVPYLALAATGPLIQCWFHHAWPGRSPYRLYALSNLGSLLALCSYPFFVEPVMALPAQSWLWTGTFVAYAGCLAMCARKPWSEEVGPLVGHAQPSGAAAGRDPRALWLALSASGSLLLMGTTSLVCQDLTAMPLLWVLPLALYLLTFILCFDQESRYRRSIFLPLLLMALVLVNLTLHEVLALSMWWQVALYCLVLFLGCMVCHGELVRSKPAASRLTGFYLTVAGGGALGGVVAVLVAPLLFPDFWEYHLALAATACLAVAGSGRKAQPRPAPRLAIATGGIACIGLCVSLVHQAAGKQAWDVEPVRNFYGVLHVQRRVDPFGRDIVQMIHGTTIHGTQLTGRDRASWPTTYYGRLSGIGVALSMLEDRGPRRIGVVGLGAGTIAALARGGDLLRFYEINPEVERVAREHFSYLRDSAAEIEVVIGDGRLELQREVERGALQGFHLLAIDAFNSDSVPVHLLTEEALAVYAAHLRPDGVLAFHVSNRYVDLIPVMRGLARRAGLGFHLLESPGEPERAGTIDTQWVLLMPDRAMASLPQLRHFAEPEPAGATVLWTDDFASLLPLLGDGEAIRGRLWRAPLQGTFVVDSADLLREAEEDHAILELRRLHGETRGAAPVVAATLVAPPAGRSLEEYGDVLYDRLRLAGEAQAFGVLLLILENGSTHLRLGTGWSAERRRDLELATASELEAGVDSPAVAAAIEQVAQRVRAWRVQAAPPRVR